MVLMVVMAAGRFVAILMVAVMVVLDLAPLHIGLASRSALLLLEVVFVLAPAAAVAHKLEQHQGQEHNDHSPDRSKVLHLRLTLFALRPEEIAFIAEDLGRPDLAINGRLWVGKETGQAFDASRHVRLRRDRVPRAVNQVGRPRCSGRSCGQHLAWFRRVTGQDTGCNELLVLSVVTVWAHTFVRGVALQEVVRAGNVRDLTKRTLLADSRALL